MRLPALLVIVTGLALSPVAAPARSLVDGTEDLLRHFQADSGSDLEIAQSNGGKSLSEAIEQVRRQTNGRILSAETRTSGDREIHYIKVLTADGKVKTVQVQGRRLNR